MTKPNGPKCGGKLHGRDGTCTLPAGWGTDHKGFGRCRKHLGNAPTVAKAAERERLEYEARAELARLDVKPVDNPLAELQKLAGQALAWKDAIGSMVNDLKSIRYENGFGEQLRAEVELFERAMDRCERVLVAMARLNIDERMVKISEAQGKVIIEVMQAAFAELGLDPEIRAAVRPVIARHLRLAAERERRAISPART
jgi:hypothetical protein